MKSALVGFILTVYHLIGLKSGPKQNQLEQILAQNHPQAQIMVTSTVQRPSQPISRTSEPLTLTAASVYAIDADTMTPLFSINSHKPLPIASLTKISTALVALRNHSAEGVITIPVLPAYNTADALLHVTTGEQFRFDQLLAALLIPSANDAADSLALATKPTIESFSASMNQLAKDWGIDGVHYSNPSGLTDNDNYASAEALAKLTKLALKNQLFSKITSTPHTTITDLNGRSFTLNSTNELLGSDPRISGIKTGYTPVAGQCFVGLATVKGHRVITVILGSSDRFGETRQLLDWIERNWDWL